MGSGVSFSLYTYAARGKQDLVGPILCLCQGDLQLLCLDVLTIKVQLLAAVCNK